ncbi:hypothetical protein E4U49_001853 [Claviceps purpurea]|nr:hypothetical protein E4U49_001853 [Claviceps purpurea]
MCKYIDAVLVHEAHFQHNGWTASTIKKKCRKSISGTGNRTLGCSVRASDVSHYTIPDALLVDGSHVITNYTVKHRHRDPPGFLATSAFRGGGRATEASYFHNAVSRNSRTFEPTKLIWAYAMKRKPPEELTEGDLYLRRWQTSDLVALETAARSSIAELSRWMPWASKGYGLADAQQFLAFTNKSWKYGDEYDYAIIIDGQPMDTLEIGYWLASHVTGRGWATRASAMLINVARELGAKHVQIRHAKLNIRSSKVPLRLGFHLVSTHVMEQEGKGTQEREQSVLWELSLVP